jgi:hypothetical protein
MAEREYRVTRREAGKIILAGLVSVATLPYQVRLLKNIPMLYRESEIGFLDEVKETEKLPSGFAGVHFNVPYLWNNTVEGIHEFTEFAYKATHPAEEIVDSTEEDVIRVLPESFELRMEKKWGEYNKGLLDKLEFLTEVLPKKYKIIVPFIDGYWIFRSNLPNFMYDGSPLESPYLPTKTVGKPTKKERK